MLAQASRKPVGPKRLTLIKVASDTVKRYRLPMDTRFLESFIMVVEHGSVAAAARRLNLTDAAVTQRVRALEREIGSKLIGRSGRTVRATEAGAAILSHAKILLRGVKDLRSVANEERFSGELNLGAISSALTGILPALLASLSEKYPLLKLFITPGSSEDLYQKVTSGELDAAVIVEPQVEMPKTCDWTLWREEPFVVLAPRSMKETGAHRLLETQPFIRYDRNQLGGRLANKYLQKVKIRPQDRYELDSLEAIAVLVDRGLGVSLVPDWSQPWPEGLNLRKIPLPQPFESRHIGLLWRRSSPRIRLVQALDEDAPRVAVDRRARRE
jgi:DNA-binding transcriptional LysR family regulator